MSIGNIYYDTKLIMNQVGYLTCGPKYFTVLRPRDLNFTVVDLAADNKPVYEGILEPIYGGDLEEGFVGNFSAVETEGTYRILLGEIQSDIVVVSDFQYFSALRTIYNYYQMQRCGDSLTGWHSPCHLKPAEDSRTGEMKDVTGGWHQSGDTRKWLFGTSPAMFGLFALANCSQLRPWMPGCVKDEMKWGNLYFHKMMREDGGLMDYVSIPNDWDDHRTRKLASDDASFMTYFNVIAGQCMAAMVFCDEEPEYAKDCLARAKRLFAYTDSSAMPDHYQFTPFLYHEFLGEMFVKSFRGSSVYLADRLLALLMLYQASGEKTYLEEAMSTATAYCGFQVPGDPEQDLAAGSFYLDREHTQLDACYEAGDSGPAALCMLAELVQEHADRGLWLETISRIAKQAVLTARKNPYGLVASYWYKDPAVDRRPGGSMYYKYFFADNHINIGVNYEILYKSVFLMRAARFTDFAKECCSVAQRQVDWVFGCNPFGLSTCEGLGYTHRQQLITVGEFVPPVPQIPGAVHTGIGCLEGTDSPQFGLDVTQEYDMPCTAMLIWAIVELLNGCKKE